MRFRRPPKTDKPCCTHDNAECSQYHWWLKQYGKTVRITQGAFAGYIGRLTGFAFTSGTILHRAGCHIHASTRSIEVAYSDLEVVDGPVAPTPCCSCCCDHCNRCGQGLIGGECYEAKSRGYPRTTREHADWIMALALYGIGHTDPPPGHDAIEQITARQAAARHIQDHLEKNFQLKGCC